MEMMEQRAVRVQTATDVAVARRAATAVCRDIGLDDAHASNVAIVVSEAATNVLKHGGGGEILVSAAAGGAVAVLALDRGRGIADVAHALVDGTSTAGSPGNGLGAIRRLSSRFDVYTGVHGTVLLAVVGARAAPQVVEIGAVSVAKSGEDVCGDAWAWVDDGERMRVLVIDGLGHGPDAAEAARRATRVFRDHPAESPSEVVDRIHDRLRATRGAAGALAELDRAQRLVRFAGIGNIGGAIVTDGPTRSMVSHHGILGHQLRAVREFTYEWPLGSTVVLYSDGMTSRWSLDRYPGITTRHPMLAAGLLYRDFRREHDDSTIVVVREAA
jgi:anti-sigma regulatory factor (Ser/Thr protein kinase)